MPDPVDDSVQRQQQREAGKFVQTLYTATEGRPMDWRVITGLATKGAAINYAVEQGWIIVEGGSSFCLTVTGAALARQSQL
jgi:hypothetical protein